MNILFYLIILMIGAMIGSKIKSNKQEGFVKHIGLIQNLALYFLLFMMGTKIGLDKEILRSFGTIGLQGFLLALATVIFSIIGVRMVSKGLLTESAEEQIEHDL
ncbi:LysO family transporter [Alkaliphilus crotonatoxidans]